MQIVIEQVLISKWQIDVNVTMEILAIFIDNFVRSLKFEDSYTFCEVSDADGSALLN